MGAALTDAQVRRWEPLVLACVKRTLGNRTLPQQIDRDDVTQVAWEAFAASALRHRPGGSPLHVYAWTRMAGAIKDLLRAEAAGGRRVQRNRHLRAAAASQLERQLGREPTREELASEMQLSSGALRALEAEIRESEALSGDVEIANVDHAPGRLLDAVADPRADTAAIGDVVDLRAALAELSERERRLLIGRANGRSGDELAQEEGVTAARISQLQTGADAKLARRLAS